VEGTLSLDAVIREAVDLVCEINKYLQNIYIFNACTIIPNVPIDK
jgi:hypothetical protein